MPFFFMFFSHQNNLPKLQFQSIVKPFPAKQIHQINNLLPFHLKRKTKGKPDLPFIAGTDTVLHFLYGLSGVIVICKVIFHTICFKQISVKCVKGIRKGIRAFQLCGYGYFIKVNLNIT